MTFGRGRLAALALGALVAIGTACPKEPAPVAPPPPPAVAPTPRPLRIAMIGKSSTNPIFLSARTGAGLPRNFTSIRHRSA